MFLNFAHFYARLYGKHEPVGPWQHFAEAPLAHASDQFAAPDSDADPEGGPLPDGTQAASDNDFP